MREYPFAATIVGCGAHWSTSGDLTDGASSHRRRLDVTVDGFLISEQAGPVPKTSSVHRIDRCDDVLTGVKSTMAIQWNKDIDSTLGQAQQTGRPILLDFSAAPA